MAKVGSSYMKCEDCGHMYMPNKHDECPHCTNVSIEGQDSFSDGRFDPLLAFTVGHEGCPHCGSYEGDRFECPECGHGQ